MTNLEKAEAAYNIVKLKINKLLSDPEIEDEEEISNQNLQMLEYFNQLNQIVTFISDNSKIPTKMKNNNNKIKNIKIKKEIYPSKNNEKILNRNKNENEKKKKKKKKK